MDEELMGDEKRCMKKRERADGSKFRESVTRSMWSEKTLDAQCKQSHTQHVAGILEAAR